MEKLKNVQVVPQLDVELLEELKRAVQEHNSLVEVGVDTSAQLSTVENLLKRMKTNLELVKDELDKLPPGRPFESLSDIEKLALEYGYECCASAVLMNITPEVKAMVHDDLARRFRVVPVKFDRVKNELTLAIADPTNLEALDSLRIILKMNIDGVLVSKEDLDKAISHYYGTAEESIEEVFLACRRGVELTEKQLLMLAAEYGMEAFTFRNSSRIEKSVLDMMSGDIARRYQVIPVMYKGKALTVAITDPTNLKNLDSLHILLKMDVEVILVTKTDLKNALDLYYPQMKGVDSGQVSIEPEVEPPPFIGGNSLTESDPEP